MTGNARQFQEWNASETTFRQPPFFLAPSFIADAAGKAGLDPSDTAALNRVAAAIQSSPPLARLAWHQHHLLFRRTNSASLNGIELPLSIPALGEDFPAYNLLLALSGFPAAADHLRRFPPEVLDGVYRDVGLWAAHHRKQHHQCGISTGILNWEHGLVHGALVRIGRLQFAIKTFHPDYHVFRNRQTGAIRTLARDGVAVNRDGLLDGVDGLVDGQAWRTTFEQEPDAAAGFRVSPRGFISRERVRLPLAVWAPVLKPGDPILDVHIPAGEPLALDRCGTSMAGALDFFRAFFPDRPVAGFSCHAWLLDIQLERLLPPESRILAFQREWHLYPSRGGGADSLVRIFGDNGLKGGMARAPRETALQRAAAGFLERGGRLRAGGGFYLADDLPFGRGVYRS